jgi:NACHT domain
VLIAAICNHLLTEHKRQLSSNPLDVKGKSFDGVYVPLGLVERKEKQRPQIDRNLDPSADRGSELYQVETTPIEHDEFLNVVGDCQTGEHIVILGEPGAGKTTLLTRVWEFLLDTNRETPIIIAWISLAAVKDLDLEAYLHHIWLKQICKSTEIDTYWQSFQTLLDDQRVWLLFDGADEMGGDGLTKIKTMLTPIWVKSTIRSVVTCRLNLWDASSQNVLKNDFQIFRTLDFKQDLVEAFIVKWFDDDAVAGKQLIAALDETGKERIKDLSRNPLRLTLLCNIWQRGESLPDTQAVLYHKFVNYFYSWSKFPELAKLRGELDRLMGELAKYGINKPMLRFRFTETELRNQSIDPEHRGALETLGWLNCVGVDERDDKVYAFFHPTFQEYFAACSIDDWDYFLPKQHEDRPILGESGENLYRVFEQEWRQPMLLWFGREDIRSELKEKFIEKLINFQDRTGDFYYYRAYCIAAICVGDFKSSRRAEEIVQQIVKWAFGYFNAEKGAWITYLKPISSLARDTIPFTHRGHMISGLEQILSNNFNSNTSLCRCTANFLSEIDTGNRVAIVALSKIIHLCDRFILFSDDILPEIKLVNISKNCGTIVITELLRFFHNPNSYDDKLLCYLADLISVIGVNNETAIATLEEFILNIQNSDRYQLCYHVGAALGKIDANNRNKIAIAILEQFSLLGNTEEIKILDYYESLDLSDSCQNPRWGAVNIRILAAQALDEIDNGNQIALSVIFRLMARNDFNHDELNCYWWAFQCISRNNMIVVNKIVQQLNRTSLNRLNSRHKDCYEDIRYYRDEYIEEIDEAKANEGTIRIDPWEGLDLYDSLYDPVCPENLGYLFDYQHTIKLLGIIETGRKIVILALIEFLKNRNPNITNRDRLLAAQTLGEIALNDKIAKCLLGDLLKSENLSEEQLSYIALALGKIDKNNPQAISTLKQIFSRSHKNEFRYHVAISLGEISQSNKAMVSRLEKLLSAKENSFCCHVAKKLGEIDRGNVAAITTLETMLSDNQHWCERNLLYVAETLGGISHSNATAITTLEKMLLDNQHWNEEEFQHIVKKIVEIDHGNVTAIAILERLILNDQRWDKENLCSAAIELSVINPSNEIAFKTLMSFFSSHEIFTTNIYCRAIDALSKMSKGYENSIFILEGFLQNGLIVCDEIHYNVATKLNEINKGNETVISILVAVLCGRHSIQDCSTIFSSFFNWGGYDITSILQESLSKGKMSYVINRIKSYVTSEVYESDFERFQCCGELLSHCALALPYGEFHAAWHQTNSLANSSLFSTSLYQQLNHRNNTIYLDITDLNTHTIPDEITTELSIRIYQQLTITPIPDIPTIPQLKRQLINRQLHPHLVLILEHPNPTATLITTISNLHTPNQIQLIWLTNAPIPHALRPEQENLIAAIWSAIDRFTEE